MIKNSRQYGITKAAVEQLESELLRVQDATPESLDVHPRLAQAEVDALKSQIADLRADLARYDELRSGAVPSVLLDSLEGIPRLLVQARIAKGLTQADLAGDLGLKPQQIQQYEATNYGSASLERILKVARTLGVDISGGEAALPIPSVLPPDEWSKLPLAEMFRKGWLPGTREQFKDNPAGVIWEYMAGFSDDVSPAVMLRRTIHRRSKGKAYSLIAWTIELLRRAERTAGVSDYVPGSITADFIRAVVRLSPRENGPAVARDFLAAHGIALVVLPHLQGTRLDGAATITSDGRPTIGMSLRYDRLDNFWFTLLHELVHLWLHLDSEHAVFVDDLDMAADRDPAETEADSHARELSVPRSVLRRDKAYILPSVEATAALAERLGVHPAIVAGRLRHEKGDFSILGDLIGNRGVRIHFADFK